MAGMPPFDPAAIQQMMSNPQFAQMAQSMLNNPAIKQLAEQVSQDKDMQEAMKSMQAAAETGDFQSAFRMFQENPRMLNFTQDLGQKIMEGNPMFKAFQDPDKLDAVKKEFDQMQSDPEFAELMKELQTDPSAMMKHWTNPEVLKKFSKYGERLAQSGVFGDMLPADIAKQMGGMSLQDGAGAAPEEEEEEDGVCLHDAVQDSDAELLKEILKSIEVDDADEEDRTALHLAVGYGELECAQVLLDHKANVNASDKSLNTPLHYAAGYGQADAVKLLLKQEGLDKNAKNNEGHTALEVAEMNEKADIVALLKA